MTETTPRGIQATLADYFSDTEYFSVQDAKELIVDHQNRDVNRESIRARIYEGIDKGLFERVGKGLYTVTRKDEQGRENTCLLINGDGRDLSMFPDNSVDALITDHPYDTSKSLVGRNRNFADYELFQYTEKDMSEKFRILKPGHFLVEFLPEENADNYQYLYQVKELARKAGFEYYAKVPWQKGDKFVANTGRKSKNTEDIVFFSKGRARELRQNAQKNKQYNNSRAIVVYKDFIPGSTTVHASEMGGMGTSYETKVDPIDVNIQISVSQDDAEKAKDLLNTAWEDAVIYSYEKSPLDKDNGGSYTLEELYDKPVQEYMLRYLQHAGLSFVDLSPGPDDIFKANTHVIVNPTNLMGPMGAGLAKAFNERYPYLEGIYKESCRQRKFTSQTAEFKSPYGVGDEILISESRAMFEGNLFLFGGNPDMNRPAILCFPTKRHWSEQASLELIEAGLKTFVNNYKHFNIKSITFPKLGCGLGGLDWEKDVKPLMQKYLGNLPGIDVQICGDTLKKDVKEHYMSGTAGMLPTVFNIAGPSRKEKIHQAEKPVELIAQILRFVTKEDELVLDQFAGSGSVGEASLREHRNSILIEKDPERFRKMHERIAALGDVEVFSPEQKEVVNIAIDALEAVQDGPDAMVSFAEYQNQHGMPLDKAYASLSSLMYTPQSPDEKLQQEALEAAAIAIEDSALCKERMQTSNEHGDSENHTAVSSDLPGGEGAEREQSEQSEETTISVPSDDKDPANNTEPLPVPEKKVLECSSRGDRRFSALYAKISIRGKERSIEEIYQDAKRLADGKRAGKGKPFDHIICPFTGDKLPASEAGNLYKGLWITYLKRNPALVDYAKGFDEFHDMFRGEHTVNCQADVIASYVKDADSFVGEVRQSAWYQNMASKKKPPLSEQIQSAQGRSCASLPVPPGKSAIYSPEP